MEIEEPNFLLNCITLHAVTYCTLPRSRKHVGVYAPVVKDVLDVPM